MAGLNRHQPIPPLAFRAATYNSPNMRTHDTTNTHTAPGPALKLLSLNIRGLRTKVERVRALIRDHNPDFVLIQETNVHDPHLQRKIEQRMKPEVESVHWCSDIHKTHSRGVATLKTSSSKAWSVRRFDFDHSGRLALLEINNRETTYNLVNLYGPVYNSQDTHTFYDNFRRRLKHLPNHPVIIGGDFNVALDP